VRAEALHCRFAGGGHIDPVMRRLQGTRGNALRHTHVLYEQHIEASTATAASAKGSTKHGRVG